MDYWAFLFHTESLNWGYFCRVTIINNVRNPEGSTDQKQLGQRLTFFPLLKTEKMPLDLGLIVTEIVTSERTTSYRKPLEKVLVSSGGHRQASACPFPLYFVCLCCIYLPWKKQMLL